nr:hypothetical protein [Tanacetum cinerariifolium]
MWVEKQLMQTDPNPVKESFRAKRKRGCSKVEGCGENEENLSLGQLGGGNFWYPVTSLQFSSPWSFVNELADLGDKGVALSSHRERVVKETSSGSGSRSSSPEIHQSLDLDGGLNGVGEPNPNQSLDLLAVGNESHDEEVGFELISLLLGCLEAISIHREVNQTKEENETALRFLNQSTPILKFIHFTSNKILLRAFEGKDKVHILDFDIKQGLQWPSFYQSLASKNSPPSHIRITGVGESKQHLIKTIARLSIFAEALNLELEFHLVVDRLEDVILWMLHVKEGETMVVNCLLKLHKMLYDGTGGTLRDFFELIRSTNSSIVVVAKQEAEHNDMMLEKRVSNSLMAYGIVGWGSATPK